MSDKKQENPRTVKQTSKKKKILLYIGIAFIIILLTTVSYGYHIYSTAEDAAEESYKEIGRENEISDLREEKVDPIEDNVSVLIIGVDDSEEREYNENSRSDALILATFNKSDNDVKLLSIPRDTYVYVPKMDQYSKINHAHFYGGPKATIETVEDFLDIPVDYFVRVNFDAFIEVVDTLGGVYFDVPFEMDELDSKDNKEAIHLEPGYQKLDGEESLAIVRTRKYDNDFERGKRQQEMIKAITKEAVSVSSAFKLENLIKAIGDNMTTNITFNEMKNFAAYGLSKDIEITSIGLEGSGDYMDDGLWYYVIDEVSKIQVSNELRKHLNLPIETTNQTELSVDDPVNTGSDMY